MKRRTAIIVLASVAAVILIVAGLLMIPPDRIVPFLYGARFDGIEQKRIETNWILEKYEITGFPREIREWLTRGHDGAFGEQVFFSFIEWGLQHPADFIAITEGVEPAKREKLVYMLAGGVIDNLDEEEFGNVFGGSEAPIIREVSQKIKEQKTHIERHKS